MIFVIQKSKFMALLLNNLYDVLHEKALLVLDCCSHLFHIKCFPRTLLSQVSLLQRWKGFRILVMHQQALLQIPSVRNRKWAL